MGHMGCSKYRDGRREVEVVFSIGHQSSFIIDMGGGLGGRFFSHLGSDPTPIDTGTAGSRGSLLIWINPFVGDCEWSLWLDWSRIHHCRSWCDLCHLYLGCGCARYLQGKDNFKTPHILFLRLFCWSGFQGKHNDRGDISGLMNIRGKGTPSKMWTCYRLILLIRRSTCPVWKSA